VKRVYELRGACEGRRVKGVTRPEQSLLAFLDVL